MTRSVVLSAVLACVFAAAGHSRTTLPLIAEATQNYGFIKNNVLQLAEKMPEEHYGFKPTNDVRPFGQGVAHVADLQASSCGLVRGDRKPFNAADKTSKAEIVAALKESFAICDAAFASMTDASASEMVQLGQSTRYRSKMGLLVGMISHSNEQYGYLSVYLRLKGIVPPSTEAAAARERESSRSGRP
jgi:hypothetical protein